MKKRLITLFSLSALLVFVAGIGTFAWFTGTFETKENSASSNEIKLLFNMYGNPDEDGDGISDSQIITLENLMPGIDNYHRKVYVPGFQVFNQSQEAIKLKMEIIPESSAYSDGTEAPSLLDVLLFSGEVHYNYGMDEYGNDLRFTLDLSNEVTLNELLDKVNAFIAECGPKANEDGAEGLKPFNENVMFDLYARLPATAGNQYQGIRSSFTLRFIGTQLENPGWTE